MEAEKLQHWNAQLSKAEKMIPLLGDLYRSYSIIVVIYGRGIANHSPQDIVKFHNATKYLRGNSGLTCSDTLPFVEALAELAEAGAVRQCLVDVGKLCHKLGSDNAADPSAVRSFLSAELGVGASPEKALQPMAGRHVVLFGFGRIGRLLARLLLRRVGSGEKLLWRAVVVRSIGSIEKRASLLRRDSVHGQLAGSIKILSGDTIAANGVVVKFIEAPNGPEKVEYEKYGIKNAVLVDTSGAWRDRAGLSRHLRAGTIDKVVLSAPAKGDDVLNVVYGVNHHLITDDMQVVAAASCTTNAVAVVLKALTNRYQIDDAHIEVIHSYTNDQNLADGIHSKHRRGRAAALNMVLTETGASKAVAQAIPELAGKLTASSVRVPLPDVSLAVCVLQIGEESKGELSVEAVNAYLSRVSLDSPLQAQIDFNSSPEVASSDFVGNPFTVIVDGQSTVVRGRRLNLSCWFDNEFGYTQQLFRVVQHVALGADHHPAYPAKGNS